MLSALRPHLLALLVGSGLLFSLAACDNPTGVGADVGPDFDGGEPSALNVPPEQFAGTEEPVVTGNNVRVLAGTVDDPRLGTINATGYIDVGRPSTLTEGFIEAGEFTSAELRFDLNYAYGDTLSSLDLVLRDMNAEWEATGSTGARRITADSIGAEITRFSVSPVDTNTIVVQLPDAWLQANAATLRDTATVNDRFHGFQIAPANGNAVAGFETFTSELRVFAGQDSASYRTLRTLTSLDREGDVGADSPILMQNGFGRLIRFSFDFDDVPFDTLSNAPLNRASIIFPFDASLYEDAPANFVRPIPNSVELVGFANDSDTSLVSIADLELTEAALEEGSLVYGGANALSIFQEAVLGNVLFERFRLRLRTPGTLGQEPITIDPLLIRGADDPDEPSRARLIITPL